MENVHIAPVVGPEIPSGHIVVEGDRVAALGPGPAPDLPGARRVVGG
ncbi:MAG: 8-oxoguanine deaminase, partial [Nonomuraea sp.]|nr:8-oxoguanine deaminase [Nonomuraea sp.]